VDKLLNHFDPFHDPETYFPKISTSSFHQILCVRNVLFPGCFPTKILYGFLVSDRRAVYPAYAYLVDLTTTSLLGDVCELQSPFSYNILHSTYFASQALEMYLLPRVKTTFHCHTEH